jgi:GH25 family lysozyme M1 (1,4-beta-N-acetylmuramidase)
MNETIKKILNITGAIAISATLGLYSLPSMAQAAENKEKPLCTDLITALENDKVTDSTTVISSEFISTTYKKDGGQLIGDYIVSGNTFTVLVPKKNKNTSLKQIDGAIRNNCNNKITYRYDGNSSKYPNYIRYVIYTNPSYIAKGIDVSAWQEEIDWEEASKHIDFAILRVMDAISKDDNGDFQIDRYIERNLEECKKYNVPVGVYWFSRATTEDEAIKEADKVLEVLGDEYLNYPVYIDVEGPEQLSLDDEQLKRVITAANETIRDGGYYPAVYINNSIKHRIDGLPYDLWLTSSPTYNNDTHIEDFNEQDFDVYYKATTEEHSWQYCSTGKIPGIEGNVDFDYVAGLSQYKVAVNTTKQK